VQKIERRRRRGFRVGNHHHRAVALAHEPFERVRLGRRQPLEAADDHDVEGVERRAGERRRLAAARRDRS
jgi:hypothetical protein